jgi:hypothetical protein
MNLNPGKDGRNEKLRTRGLAALVISALAVAATVLQAIPASASPTPPTCIWIVQNTDPTGLALRTGPVIPTGSNVIARMYDGTEVQGKSTEYTGSGLDWYFVSVIKLNAGKDGPKDPPGLLGDTGYAATGEGGTSYLRQLSCS